MKYGVIDFDIEYVKNTYIFFELNKWYYKNFLLKISDKL